MTRETNCDENLMEIKKGPWTRDEDQKLLAYVQEHGHGSWRALPAKAGLQRCGKSCRLRWTNYLNPHIKRGKFSAQEDVTITRLHALLGNRWSSIATHLPKRTDNEIKNYWNTRLKKRLTRMGIDPATHKPKNICDGSGNSREAANISHMAQWETARLEAEVRLVRESKIVSNLQLHRRAISRPPPQPLKLLNSRYLDVLKVWQATNTENGFFGSPGSLESPTSILNFSCSSPNTVRTVGDHGISFTGNDSISNGACGIMGHENITEGQVKGNLENSLHLENNNTVNVVNCDSDMSCLMDLITPVNSNFHTYNLDTVGATIGDSWNELLNLVTSSPTKSRVVLE